MTSIGKFDGVMAPTTPDRFLDHGADVALAEQPATVQWPFPLEGVDEACGVTQRVRERPVQLCAGDRHVRAADLGDQLLAQRVPLGGDGVLELAEAALTQRTVGRPVGLVERTSGGPDRATHVAWPGRRGTPSTEPVAGLMLSNSAPDSAATSSPSISIRDSASVRRRGDQVPHSAAGASTISLTSSPDTFWLRVPCPLLHQGCRARRITTLVQNSAHATAAHRRY